MDSWESCCGELIETIGVCWLPKVAKGESTAVQAKGAMNSFGQW